MQPLARLRIARCFLSTPSWQVVLDESGDRLSTLNPLRTQGYGSIISRQKTWTVSDDWRQSALHDNLKVASLTSMKLSRIPLALLLVALSQGAFGQEESP